MKKKNKDNAWHSLKTKIPETTIPFTPFLFSELMGAKQSSSQRALDDRDTMDKSTIRHGQIGTADKNGSNRSSFCVYSSINPSRKTLQRSRQISQQDLFRRLHPTEILDKDITFIPSTEQNRTERKTRHKPHKNRDLHNSNPHLARQDLLDPAIVPATELHTINGQTPISRNRHQILRP